MKPACLKRPTRAVQGIHNDPAAFLSVPLLCIASRTQRVAFCSSGERHTARCVKCMSPSEAEHSEAEPPALLSVSGHMVGVLAWELTGALLPEMNLVSQPCGAHQTPPPCQITGTPRGWKPGHHR